ncbi:MAG: F0F1 ATP synthase subunit epsilon [Syntrophotaleaceae bacterium]
MRLKVFTPTGVVFDREVAGIVAEGSNGHFGLRPRHIDFVSDLVPGLLRLQMELPNGDEEYIAVDRGLLIKQGDDVLVSVHDAVGEAPLEELMEIVNSRFATLNDKERAVHSALARLEADFLRRFMDL